MKRKLGYCFRLKNCSKFERNCELWSEFLGYSLLYLLKLYIYHVGHLVGHISATMSTSMSSSTVCEGSETLTEWISESVVLTYKLTDRLAE